MTVESGFKRRKVFEQRGTAAVRPAAWGALTADLRGFAGRTIRIVVEATDTATPSTIEAAIDDLRITQETLAGGPAGRPAGG